MAEQQLWVIAAEQHLCPCYVCTTAASCEFVATRQSEGHWSRGLPQWSQGAHSLASWTSTLVTGASDASNSHPRDAAELQGCRRQFHCSTMPAELQLCLGNSTVVLPPPVAGYKHSRRSGCVISVMASAAASHQDHFCSAGLCMRMCALLLLLLSGQQRLSAWTEVAGVRHALTPQATSPAALALSLLGRVLAEACELRAFASTPPCRATASVAELVTPLCAGSGGRLC